MKSSLFFKGKEIGTIDETNISNLVLPPLGSVSSPALVLKMKIGKEAIQALFGTFGGKNISIDVVSTMAMDIGGYKFNLDYNQVAVPTRLVAKA